MEFKGFFPETVAFFEELKKHNTRAWFEEHREQYEKYVMEPSAGFIVELGRRLRAHAPEIVAEPQVNRSIFRLNRDVRFSKDKSPYKTHLGIWLWEGIGPRMECPGFYFHLEPPNILLAAGIYMFPKPLMEAYRESAVHPDYGVELDKAIRKVSAAGYSVGDEQFKKVPRGYDPNHPNARYLLFGGLTAFFEEPVPKVFYSESFVDYCYKHFVKMLPLHAWLLDMKERMGGSAHRSGEYKTSKKRAKEKNNGTRRMV